MMRLLMVLTVLAWVAVGFKAKALEERKEHFLQDHWYQEMSQEMDSVLKKMEEVDV